MGVEGKMKEGERKGVVKERDYPCHFLLPGIFPTQELNPCVLHWQADFFYHLSHQGSPPHTSVFFKLY